MKKLLSSMLLLAAVPSLANAQAIELAEIPACLQLVPGAIGLTPAPVDLQVRVLLDGVSQGTAQTVVSRAEAAYSSMEISIVASYQVVNFSGNDATGLIQQAKSEFVGGVRPPGIDLVYVLTSKDIGSGAAGDATAGQADCIGGVAFPDSAFAVGENIADSPLNLLVYNLSVNMAAKIMAHELGHLLGGHHHYANCIEGLLSFGDSPCTLMFNDVGFQNIDFSTLNSLVVQGEAQVFAAP